MDMNKTAEIWAKNNEVSEAEAFEAAIKRIKNVPLTHQSDFEVDDKYEQAYRQGFEQGSKSEVTKELKNILGDIVKELMSTIIDTVEHIAKDAKVTVDVDKIVAENAELRDALKIQSEEIQRLREYIARNEEEYYE